MTCTIDNCDGRVRCRGLCSTHYGWFLNGKPLDRPRYWHPRAEKYLDLMDLLRLGETPVIAAERIGVSAAAAARWFRRHGHIDLALRYEPIAKRARVTA